MLLLTISTIVTVTLLLDLSAGLTLNGDVETTKTVFCCCCRFGKLDFLSGVILTRARRDFNGLSNVERKTNHKLLDAMCV